MFETAMVDERAGRGAMGFSGSLLLQSGLVSGVVALSLWMPVALPEPPELNVALPAPRFRNAVKVVATTIERSAAAMVAQHRFRYVPPAAKPGLARPAEVVMDEMLVGLPVTGSGPVGIPGGHGDFLLPGVVAPPPPPPKPVATPEPAPATRLMVGGDVLASKLLHRVQPVYPEIARRARIQGSVLLHGVITREGRISKLRVLSGHPLLVKAAMDAVSQWLYSPTLLNQKPVEVEAPIEVRFILGQ